MPDFLLAGFSISRGDIATYVNALFTVYIILIFLNILTSWIPRMPYNRALLAVVNFVKGSTDPYLNLFRRFLPPLGGGGMAFDLSPVVGLLILLVAQTVIVGLIN